MAEAPRVLIVIAPYYSEISDMLLEGAVARLEDRGVEVHVREVPGALELPIAIRIAAEADQFDGYVALGCVIRGETSHYDIVANESARALMDIGASWGVPVGNGILTVDNRDQAIVRADPAQKNKGADAAAACLALMELRGEMAEIVDSEAREPTFLPESEQFDIAESKPTRTA